MLALNQPSSWSSLEIRLDSPDEPELDPDFEDELVALLGELEFLREGMVAARDAKKVPQSLSLAAEFMKQVAEFSDRNCAFTTNREIDEATRLAKDFRSGLAVLREKGQFEAAAVRRCFAALQDAVANYFVVFTDRFPSSRAARRWVEVAATFLVELKHFTRDPLSAG
jgi:hypothetical protein